MLNSRSFRLVLGICFLASLSAATVADNVIVSSPVQLQGSVNNEVRSDRRYEHRDVVESSVRRYNLQDLSEIRHRPSINTYLFPQLSINHDLDWMHPHSQNQHQHQNQNPHNQYHPEQSHHTNRPEHSYQPQRPPRPPPNHHKVTKTVTETVTKGPTVFWTEFVPFCTLDTLPSSCSVATEDETVTTTATSNVLRVTESTFTYEDANCLDIVSDFTTDVLTIYVTTTEAPVITVTATVGNSITDTRTAIEPTTVVVTSSTTTVLYEKSINQDNCYDFDFTTRVPFPGPTFLSTSTVSYSDTDKWSYNDLASCTNAVTELVGEDPTLYLDVLGVQFSTIVETTTLTSDLVCSNYMNMVTETLPETEVVVLYEETLYTESVSTPGGPTFTCPDTVTVTTTNVVPQVTTTTRGDVFTNAYTVMVTAYELVPFYWCTNGKSTSSEFHVVRETVTSVVTVAVPSTRLIPEQACMTGTSLPDHGCPQEFLMAVKMIMIEMTEIFIELRHLLHDLLPHVHEHDRKIIERFNNLPLPEILGNLPLKEQRDEALWSQKQLQELKEMIKDAQNKKEVPSRLFDKIDMVVSRLHSL